MVEIGLDAVDDGVGDSDGVGEDDGDWVSMMFPARSRNTPLPLAQHDESLLQQ